MFGWRCLIEPTTTCTLAVNVGMKCAKTAPKPSIASFVRRTTATPHICALIAPKIVLFAMYPFTKSARLLTRKAATPRHVPNVPMMPPKKDVESKEMELADAKRRVESLERELVASKRAKQAAKRKLEKH